MNFDTDQNVYFITINGFANGFVTYGSGEFYSDALDFTTNSETQAGSITQLGKWMTEMEAKGYKFISAEEMIDGQP